MGEGKGDTSNQLIVSKFEDLARDLLKDMFGESEVEPEKLSDVAKKINAGMHYMPVMIPHEGRGRPGHGFEFADGTVVKKADFELAEKEIEIMKARLPVKRAGMMMTDEEFNDFCKIAIPEIGLRAVRLGLVSNKVSEVMEVFKTFADRAYGKPTQSVAVVDPNKDIRAGWVIDVDSE